MICFWHQKGHLTFSYVQVEEITIEYCLHTASNDSDQVKEALKVVSVDPVKEVQGAVGAQGKQVVAGDCFSLTCLAHHEQLGQDGNRLQVDGERPQNLHNTSIPMWQLLNILNGCVIIIYWRHILIKF